MILKRLSGIILALVIAVSVAVPTNLVHEVQVEAATKKTTKKIKINRKKATIYVGQKIKLKLKNAKEKKVQWKSSNKKIATVKKGVVKGKKKGKVSITAKYKRKKYKAVIQVKKVRKIVSDDKLLSTASIVQAQKMVDGMDKGANILVSPVSLNIVLGMLANGANDSAKKELEQFFGKNTTKYNQWVADFMKRISGGGMLNTYNSVWYKKQYLLNTNFEKVMKEQYSADVTPMQMVQEDVNTINQWADKKTEGLIKEIIDRISKNTVAILMNATLFKGKWTTPFEAEKTQKKEFTLFSGNKKKVPMMHSTEGIYYENNEAIGFEKTYGKNQEYSFVAMLPKKTGKFTVAGLKPENFMKTRTKEYLVDIELPKFTYEWKDGGKLNTFLQSNGVKSIFNEFTNPMGKVFSNHSEGAYVSDVIQKCNIIVDEEGTKAAAVTAAIIKVKTCIPVEQKRKKVSLNRPFAYMILDNQTGEVLFMGKCIEP